MVNDVLDLRDVDIFPADTVRLSLGVVVLLDVLHGGLLRPNEDKRKEFA